MKGLTMFSLSQWYS